VGTWLSSQGFGADALGPDHQGVEMLGVEAAALPLVATALKAAGFDYLQCQGGYDEGPGGRLVSFYHLVKMAAMVDQLAALGDGSGPLPAEARQCPRQGHRQGRLPRCGRSIENDTGFFHVMDVPVRRRCSLSNPVGQSEPKPAANRNHEIVACRGRLARLSAFHAKHHHPCRPSRPPAAD